MNIYEEIYKTFWTHTNNIELSIQPDGNSYYLPDDVEPRLMRLIFDLSEKVKELEGRIEELSKEKESDK